MSECPNGRDGLGNIKHGRKGKLGHGMNGSQREGPYIKRGRSYLALAVVV